MVAEAGGDRVGIKISPEMNFNDISDAAPQETYTCLVEQLRGLKLAYLHVALFGATSVDYHALFRPLFDGAYLIGSGLDQTAAETVLTSGQPVHWRGPMAMASAAASDAALAAYRRGEFGTLSFPPG